MNGIMKMKKSIRDEENELDKILSTDPMPRLAFIYRLVQNLFEAVSDKHGEEKQTIYSCLGILQSEEANLAEQRKLRGIACQSYLSAANCYFNAGKVGLANEALGRAEKLLKYNPSLEGKIRDSRTGINACL